MLACVLLAAAAFVAYTARINWKLVAEEVSLQPVAWRHTHLANQVK